MKPQGAFSIHKLEGDSRLICKLVAVVLYLQEFWELQEDLKAAFLLVGLYQDLFAHTGNSIAMSLHPD